MATIRKGKTINISQEIIGKITILDNIQNTFSVICNNLTQTVFLLTESTRTSINDNGKALILNNVEYSKLNENDLIRISPSGKYEILYSIKSNDNLLFITEKCNSRCIFCPQPPKNVDDFEYYFNVNNSILDNLDKTVEYIGITGGEPLLAKEYLFKLLDKINNKLPHTEVQLLTNGKLLGNKEYFSEISNYITDKYIFGIPLYSDFENDHDNLVGCRNSYINTLKGLYNLASIGARIELRIVLNKVTISRLKQISEFIFKNLSNYF